MRQSTSSEIPERLAEKHEDRDTNSDSLVEESRAKPIRETDRQDQEHPVCHRDNPVILQQAGLGRLEIIGFGDTERNGRDPGAEGRIQGVLHHGDARRDAEPLCLILDQGRAKTLGGEAIPAGDLTGDLGSFHAFAVSEAPKSDPQLDEGDGGDQDVKTACLDERTRIHEDTGRARNLDGGGLRNKKKLGRSGIRFPGKLSVESSTADPQ